MSVQRFISLGSCGSGCLWIFCYALMASNLDVPSSWTYGYTSNLDYSLIQINEFMAANRRFVRDEDGEYSDWIELYNSGPFTFPLAGCYLTDDPLNLAKWKFPPVSMTPNSFLVIWASGKDRTNSTAPLHTNFLLNRDGGYLAFVMSDGANIISEFSSYPSQTADVSFGRDRTDSQITGFFTTPTPGAANSTTGIGFGPDVSFSRESGTFTASFSLQLSATDTNAVIRYTVGTNVPTVTSTLYTGPLTIARSTQVRARAFAPGLSPGNVQSKQYIFLDTSTSKVTGLKSSLPIVVFHNHGGGTVPVGELVGGYAQFAMIQVFEPQNGHASLTNIPTLAVRGTIHRRGQATKYNAKASLRVEIIDEYGAGKSVPFLGMPEENDWVFYAINGYDKVLMHNPLAHGLYAQMGHYTSRTRFVEVYLKDDAGQSGPITAADYNGIYVVEEKIKIDKNRIDIDKLQPENTTQPSITGGYLFSIDKDGPKPSFTAANSTLWNLDPDGPTISTPQRLPQKQYLKSYLDAFYSALTGSNWKDPVKGYAAYIDVPIWIDFHLHQTFVLNADMLRISTYYCKPRNGKIRPAALWDFDRAFGMNSPDGDTRGFNPWRWSSTGGTNPFTYPWYGKLLTDPDFWQKWIDRYQELRKSVYSYSNVTFMIQKFADEVNDATPREYARWVGQGSSDTTPNKGVVSGDGWTYRFPNPGTWAGQVQFIKTWFTNRMIFMDTNFLAQPTVSQEGGLVDIGSKINLTPAARAGSAVLYTLDGSDPRLPRGISSSTAKLSFDPVTLTITNNTRLFARSYNSNHRNLTGANNPQISSPWSGVTIANFYTSIPALRITEIMYHPSIWPPGIYDDAGYYEYIELSNTSESPLSLIGFNLTKGLEFTFTATNRITEIASRGKVLLVKNIAAFSQRYPDATNLIAGEYSGSLNNEGDRLVLLGPFGELIHDLTFKNSPATDGVGFSLVIKDENIPLSSWNDPVQWRSSSYFGGSPGATDAAPTVIQTVMANEVLSNPVKAADDAVELFNPNTVAVDIGYWVLTADIESPQKYQIPSGTIIPSLGYGVFYKSNSFGISGSTNYFGGLNNDFGFSAQGDAVYLFSGNQKGQLTGYFDGFDFGAAAPGVSFGRYTNTIGKVTHIAQKQPTLGTANAGPLVCPILITCLNSQAILSWPDSPIIWTLEEANALIPGTVWRAVKVAVELKGNRWEAIIPSPATSRFFRLRSQ